MVALAIDAPQAGALALAPQRLCWRGRAVSDEFQRYAERVASGEELAPYHGQVLARPCADSPWGVPEPPPPRPARRFVVVGALLAASAWLVGVLLVSPRAPTSEPEPRLQPNAPVYAVPHAPSHLGPLSSSDGDRLGDIASGEVLSHDVVARALTSAVTSEGTTRKVSGRRRGSPASPARAAVSSPAALAAEAKGKPGAVVEAPASPRPKTADEFDWLLDGAGSTAAAPVGEGAVRPPEVGPEATRRPAAGSQHIHAPVSADRPASRDSRLLLETPTF